MPATRLHRAVVLFLLTVSAAGAFAGGELARRTWLQVETPHFLFVYQPQDEPWVEELLHFAEPVYQEVTARFDSYPEKVVTVVFSDTDQANGFTTSMPYMMGLYVSSPAGPVTYGPRSENWLKDLLIHEFTHYVHLSMQPNPWTFRALGPSAQQFSYWALPSALLEGIAVHYETQLTSGGRGDNAFFQMLSEATLAAGDYPELAEFESVSSQPPRGRWYVTGYLFVEYLNRTYGEDTFTRFMQEYLRLPWLGYRRALRKVTGRPVTALYTDMLADLHARAPSLEDDRSRPVGPPPGWGRAYENLHGPVPVAGELWAYADGGPGHPAIVRLSGEGQAPVPVVKASLSDSSSFAATGDGGTVYFTEFDQARPHPSSPPLDSNLYVHTVATGETRLVTAGAGLFHPTVSADGRTLLAVQLVGTYRRLVQVDPVSGRLRVLFSRPQSMVYTPVLSPDGGTVAFTLNQRGTQDLYVAELSALLEGSQDPAAAGAEVNPEVPVRVAATGTAAEYFPWFADPRRLLFSSDRGGRLALYQVDLPDGEPRLLTTDPIGAFRGVLHDSALTYATYRSRGFELRSVPVPAADLPGSPGSATAPAAPDPPFDFAPMPDTAREFRGLPRPHLWLPSFALLGTLTSPSVADVGAGALLIAPDYLDRAWWQLHALYFPGAGQPKVDFSVEWLRGPARFTYSLYQDYRQVPQFRQIFQHSLGLAFQLYRSRYADRVRSAQASLSLTQGVSLSSGQSFSFVEGLPYYAGNLGTGLNAGLSGQVGRDRLTVSAGIEGFLDLELSAPSVSVDLGLDLPGPTVRDDLFLQYAATRTWDGQSDTGTELWWAAGHTLLAAEWDLALLPRLHLHGLETSSAISGVAAWQPGQDPALTVDPVLLVALDLFPQVTFLDQPLGLQLGARIWVDASNPGAFDPSTDLQFVIAGILGEVVLPSRELRTERRRWEIGLTPASRDAVDSALNPCAIPSNSPTPTATSGSAETCTVTPPTLTAP